MFEDDVKDGSWTEVFRTVVDNPLFFIIVLGSYRESKFWEMTNPSEIYLARVTMTAYSKNENYTMSEIYLLNGRFKTKDSIFEALMPYSEGFNSPNIQTKWVTLIGD